MPPCYETVRVAFSRFAKKFSLTIDVVGNTQVHWRVMKDPIRVCYRQIEELQRLLAWRVAPKSSSPLSCKSDTAGRTTGNVVNFNRPLQNTTTMHGQEFCECVDWVSKFSADQNWCKGWRTSNREDRWFVHPYNFNNAGF